MMLLRKLFFLKRIYFRHTPLALLVDAFLLFLALWVLLQQQAYWIWVPVSAACYFLLRGLLKWWIVRRRTKEGSYTVVGPNSGTSKFLMSAANEELDTVDSIRLLAEGENWKLYDTRFDFYRRTKHGRYLSKQVYYTVFEGVLRRQVPHLMFDSKQAKGQQFRYNYLGSQKLSLEGNFNAHFTAYAPNYYKVDTLSFISPEVMEDLLAAKDYDIELVDDRVFLYGPLLDQAEFPTMEKLGRALMAGLNDNLDTYRDSWLTGEERATHTTRFARQLQRNPLKPAMGLAVTVSILGTLLFLANKHRNWDILWNEFSVLNMCFIVAYARTTFNIIQDNRALNRDFRKGIHQ